MAAFARIFLVLVLLAPALVCAGRESLLRVKDLGRVQGWRENVLVGTGIVTGLAGTGDSPANRATRQALANVLAQFDLTVPPEQVNSRNVAVVMVSASLPAFAREGDMLTILGAWRPSTSQSTFAAETEIYDQKGDLIATGAGTFRYLKGERSDGVLTFIEKAAD